MLDTGASVNLVKTSEVSLYVNIDTNHIIILKGIMTHAIKTLGKVRDDFNNYKIDFHLVTDDFPIIEAGILDTEFFRENGAQINYRENYLEFNGQIIPFENISYEKNELNEKQNENVHAK